MNKLKEKIIPALIIGTTVILALVAVFTATKLYRLRNQPIEEPKAWDCSRYTFNVEASGIVTAENLSTRNEPEQQAKVYINGTQASTLNVPALAAGQQATQIGTVNVPSEGIFTWKVEGSRDCENSGQHQLTQTSCTTFEFTLTTESPSPSPSPTASPTASPSPTPVPGEPTIDIEKHTNGYDADEPKGPELVEGEDVKWEYIVTNTGDKTLYNVVVVDNKEGTITCPKSTLLADEAMTCVLHSTAKVYQYSNSATVTGEDSESTEVTDTDTSHYWGEGKVYSPTPSPTGSPSSSGTPLASGTSSPRPTSTTTAIAGLPAASTEPLPAAGVSMPTLIGISSAVLMIVGALLLVI